jgi:hypothetical protein
MAYQARVSTLGQLLRQAGDVQDLLIRQVPTHLHCSDGRSIMLISLYGLAYDRRQPSRALAHECAMVYARVLALVFTWAPPADSRLWQSLQRCPNAGMACIEMLLQSEPCGWTTCARVTDRLSLLRRHGLTRTGRVPVAHA